MSCNTLYFNTIISKKILLGYIVFTILYRLMLDYNYINIISPVNFYDQFLIKLSYGFLSWLMLIVFLFLGIPYIKTPDKFISILILFIFYFKIIPITSYIYCAPVSLDFILYEFIYYCLILICCYYLPIIKLPQFPNSPWIINSIALSLILVIIIISSVYANFRIHLNLMDVYDLREESRGYEMPSIFHYLHNAASKILPILLIYYLEKKQQLMIYIIILSLLLSFGVNGLKSTFLNLFICIFLYFFSGSPILKRIPLIFLIVIMAATLEFLVFDTFWIDQLFVRRLLYMPALIDTYFFDYIRENSPLYFNAEVDGKDVAFIIGEIWRGRDYCRANNGLFSDAYTNLGSIGIIIYPIIYAIFFKSFGKVFDKKDFIVKFFAAFIIGYIMLSSFFTVTLFSHGVLLMCIVILFMPNRNNLKETKRINNKLNIFSKISIT